MIGERARRYGGISGGEGGRYVPQARHGNYIAIGWEELGDLTDWAGRLHEDDQKLRDEFRAFYRTKISQETAVQSGIQAGQVASFVFGIRPGDIVLVRDPMVKRVHVAEVVGPYAYVDKPSDGCPYRHRRLVKWSAVIDRGQLPEKLKTSLGSLLTVFELTKHSELIDSLMGETETTRVTTLKSGGELVHALKERLLDMTPEAFERFVSELLELAGFAAHVTRLVGDKGVDVEGTLTLEFFADVNVRAQVKRIGGNVGIKEIQQLRGALAGDEHGVFITVGGFTRQAREEAEAVAKKEMKLIDGDMLVDLILRYYDEMSSPHREFLRLRRREIPAMWQFEIVTGP